MASPGRSAGRVSVRVVPDSTGFRPDLKKVLERAERAMSVSIPVTVDTARLRESVGRMREQVEKVRPALKVRGDLDQLKQSLQLARRRLTEDPAMLRLDLQLERAQAELKAFRTSFGTGPLTVDVQAQVDEAERAVEHLRRETERKKTELHLKANLDAKKLRAEVAAASRRRAVEFVARVNTASLAKVGTALAAISGGRVIGDRLKGLGTYLANLDRHLPGLAALGLAVANIGAAGLSSVGGLVSLGGSLAAISGAAVALPGVIAGGAVAVGVFAAAMADAGTVLKGIGPAFKDLQDRISSKFWDRAAAPIRGLVTGLLPQLRTGLASVASSLGGFTGAVADGLRGELGGGVLGGMLRDLSAGLDRAKGAAGPLAAILATLGTAGASYIPKLAAAFVDVSKRLSEFVQQAQDSGALTGFIDAGIGALRQLGSAVGSAGQILSGLFTAASADGGNGLTIFASTLGQIATIINGPAFQGALTTLFAGAGAAMSSLGAALGPIGQMFETLAPTLSGVMKTAGAAVGGLLTNIATALSQPAFSTGLTAFFSGIAAGLKAVGPALPAVAVSLGALGQVAGVIAGTLGQVLGAALTALAPILTTLLTAIQPIIPILGQTLVSAIQTLAPAFLSFVQQLAPLIPQIAASFTGLLTSIVPLIPQLLQIAAGLLPLIPAVLSVVDSLAGFITASNELSAKTLPIFLTVLSSVVTLVGSAVRSVGSLLSALVALFQGNFSKAGAIVRGSTSQMLAAVNSATGGMLTKISTFVSNGVAKIVDFGSRLVETVKSAWSRAKTAVSDGVTAAVELVRSLPEKAKGALGDLASLLYSAGSDLVAGFVNGISGSIGDVIGKAREVAASAVSAAKNALGINSPSRVFAQIGKFVGQGLVGGLLGTQAKVRSAATKLADQIKSAFDHRAGQISSLGKAIAKLEDQRASAQRRAAAVQDRLNGKLTASQRRSAKNQLADLRAQVKRINGELSDKKSQRSALKSIGAGTEARLLAKVKATQQALLPIAKQREVLAAKITAATKKLQDAVKLRNDYSASVRSAVNATGNITDFQTSTGRTDASFIITKLQDAVTKAKAFAAMVKQLKAQGLSNTALKQITDAGVEGGTSTAQALLAGGKKAIAQVNSLQGQLDKSGADLGKFTSSTFYQAGVDAAAGLLKGLQGQDKKLAQVAKKLAEQLAKAVKKALGIKSPSKVFRREIGQMIPAGIIAGVNDGRGELDVTLKRLVIPPKVPQMSTMPISRLAGPGADPAGVGGRSQLTENGDVNIGSDLGELLRLLDRRDRREQLRQNFQGVTL